MLAANLFDNWLFFLLVAVAMLFRWLMSAASKTSKDSSDPEERSTSAPPTASPARTVPGGPADSEEQRIRKFLEALGQPAGSRPPPPVTPRQMDAERAAREARHRLEAKRASAEAKKKIFMPSGNLPPLTTIPPPLPIESASSPQIQTEEGRSSDRSMDLLPATYEVQETRQVGPVAGSPPPASSINVAMLLRSPSGLRSAIILREVFGPPRSMQDVDLIGNA